MTLALESVITNPSSCVVCILALSLAYVFLGLFSVVFHVSQALHIM